MARERSRTRRKRDNHPTISPGDRLTLRAGPIIHGGACLAHLDDGQAVFVHFAAPGELVEAEVERARADYIEARAVAVIEASPDRIEPRCELFGQCGGCQFQHLTYEAQLAAKEGVVREQLRRIGGLPDDVVRSVVGADHPWAYRNHIRLTTGRQRGEVGFVPRGGRGLLRVDACPIADPWVNEVLPLLQGHGAGIHQIQLRRNAATGSALIAPEVPGAPVGSGQTAYTEQVCGHRFNVSAAAFFQVNAAQTEAMARLIEEALPPPGGLLVDAFAGVGTFAALFAHRFDEVIAIEESPAAIRDAELNLAGLPNVRIIRGQVERILPDLPIEPAAVILDPPRAGCLRPVLDMLIETKPPVVVYVSCNPATLARDLRILADGGFVIEHVTPLDMFPQTAHIESVTRLTHGGRDA